MKNKILHYARVIIALAFISYSVLIKAQTQSMLLPVPSENGSVINFTNSANPFITGLPIHGFNYLSWTGITGNPHNETHLADAFPNMTQYYLGQHPMCAQAVVHDKQGNLLFFIVDDNIYNKYGVSHNPNGSTISLTGEYIPRTFPEFAPEIVVFPIYDDETCYTFGLVYYKRWAGTDHSGEVFYRKITYYNNDQITLTTPILISQNIHDIAQGCGNEVNYNLAISDYRPEYNNYLLFVRYYNKFAIFTIDQWGNIDYTAYSSSNSDGYKEISFYISDPGTQSPGINVSSEMEVIKSGDYYYVAVGSCMKLSNKSDAFVNVIKLTCSDQLLIYNDTIRLPRNNNPVYDTFIERIKGLEFSPDGSKLYVTYTGQPNLYYLTVGSSGIGLGGQIDLSNFQDRTSLEYQYSEIELGRDGYMYFLHSSANGLSGGISRLNPVDNIIEDYLENNINKVYYSNDFTSFGNYFGADNDPKILLFADQIDGSDYTSYFETVSSSCCENHIYYSDWPVESKFNPTNTWTPENCPFPCYNGTVWIDENVEIPSGKEVTMQNLRFEFNGDKKLRVKPGAKLVLDNTTLTSVDDCDLLTFWGGIEIEGNSSQHQYTIGGSCAQGTVILKNGAIIENAICGIKTMNTNAASPASTTGGIIQADNSTFRNCEKAVEFMRYSNHHPTNNNHKLPNLSYINQCTFETNKSLNPDIVPFVFIRLSGVDGVSIRGCEFKNLTPSANPYENGIGIFSVNSGFNLTSVCTSQANPCPEGNIVKNKFNNLYLVHTQMVGIC